VSHHSSTQCELLQLPGYLTPGLLDFEYSNSPIHSSPDHHFCTSRKLLFFSLSFLFVPNSLFKKEKLAKSSLLNVSENYENVFLNRCGIKYYTILNGHIGDVYREIQEIGAHRRDLQTLVGVIGSGKNMCRRS
jgi:hypothetical protein